MGKSRSFRLKRGYYVTSESAHELTGYNHRVSVLKADAQSDDGWIEVAYAYEDLDSTVRELHVGFRVYPEAYEEVPADA